MLKNGIYEQVINNKIKTELLEAKANDKYTEQADIDEEGKSVLRQKSSADLRNPRSFAFLHALRDLRGESSAFFIIMAARNRTAPCACRMSRTSRSSSLPSRS